jgi:hypothetical protein
VIDCSTQKIPLVYGYIAKLLGFGLLLLFINDKLCTKITKEYISFFSISGGKEEASCLKTSHT